jgi:CDP-diacylglycerol--serine O-phosphatidyltransferase
MTRHIPNAVTLLNLIFGCIGLYACATNTYQLVPVCMAGALIADFLDGYLARFFNAGSAIGAQLDSLADNVTFGVLPGMMLLQLISFSSIGTGGSYSLNPLGYAGFIYSVFACIRLAKFNIDTRQHTNFIGMPTPAGAIFVLGLYLYYFEQEFNQIPTFSYQTIYQPITLIAITVALSVLMVSNIPMFSLKGNMLVWKGNQVRLIFLVISILIILWLKAIGLLLVILLYILVSVIQRISGFKER